jgi:hypothetical protein
VFNARRMTLGEEHCDTLHTAGKMAALYERLGRLNEAVELGETVLRTRRRGAGTGGCGYPEDHGQPRHLYKNLG